LLSRILASLDLSLFIALSDFLLLIFLARIIGNGAADADTDAAAVKPLLIDGARLIEFGFFKRTFLLFSIYFGR